MTLTAALASIALLAFVVSAAAVPLARRVALRLGIVDKPNPRKVHLTPTPMMGGFAVLLGFLIGTGFACSQGFFGTPGGRLLTPLNGIVLGSIIIFLIGIIDDKCGVTPNWKLLGQALVAVLILGFEVRLSLFMREHLVTGILTILWFVGIINAFNLLDNMNGLSSGVGLIAAVVFCYIAYGQDDIFVLGITAALAGALLGFLPYNFPHASIFLGDAGSMLIGFILATVSVQGIYLGNTRLTHLPIITPLLVLGVPLFDTLSVVVIRLARGKPIFAADKNHFSHRLVDLGMTQKQAVLLIYLVAVAVALPATLLTSITRGEAIMVLLQEIILFVIIVLIMRAGMVREAEHARGVPPPDHSDDRPR